MGPLTSQQQIEYEYQRRLRRQAMYNLYYKQQRIANLRQYIATGGDVTADPDIYKEYCLLIDEFGAEIFSSEQLGFAIHKEEDKDIFKYF